MSEVIMIVSPGKWVSEEQLIALKGIKKGTLKKAREKSFMEGREVTGSFKPSGLFPPALQK
ncbi:hypothetical protein EC30301_1827 [Escherichia coli 3030-1]|nr:hypothetical protein EC30301_1827 [Escherichia coli 3030-1]